MNYCWTSNSRISVQIFIKTVITCFLLHPIYTQSFDNIALSTVTNDPSNSWGTAWGDYDNDGDLDLYVANYSGPNRLFRNDGGEQFSDVAYNMGISCGNSSKSIGVSWGDYDNDGDLDLFVCQGQSENKLFRNDGNIFTDVSMELGFTSINNTYMAVWGDYDNDGDIDLFAANYGGANQLFQNNQDIFIDVASSLGIIETGRSRGAAWGDYDNDGDLDLYVCRGISTQFQTDLLYRNDLDKFVNVAVQSGITDTLYSVGADWGDFDNDGDLDLFVCLSQSENKLYRNVSNIFIDVGQELGLNELIDSYSPAWIDYDNDGDLDLFVTRIEGFSNILYENTNTIFSQVQDIVGLGNYLGYAIGQSWGDFNNDGLVDIYVSNYRGENAFYRNNIDDGNHWLTIKTVGSLSNKDGIGARIELMSGRQRQIREVNGGSAASSQNSIPVEFGLGSNTIVDSIIVRWPSGIVQKEYNLPIDTAITITESLYNSPSIITLNSVDNTEDKGPFLMLFRIEPKQDWQLGDNTFWFHYGIGTISDSLPLVIIHYEGSPAYACWTPEFTEITGTTELKYFLSVFSNKGERILWPVGAPSNYQSFVFGPDTTAPIISKLRDLHDVHFQIPFEKKVNTIVADDRFGVTTKLVWQINNGSMQTLDMIVSDSSVFQYSTTLKRSTLSLGDTVTYWVEATDLSNRQNTGISNKKTFIARNELVIGNWDTYWEDFEEDGQVHSWDIWQRGKISMVPVFPYIDYRLNISTEEDQFKDTCIYIKTLDLRYTNVAGLSIPMGHNIEPGMNYGYIEISKDSIDWNILKTVSGQSPYYNEQINLQEYIHREKVYIRFRADKNSPGKFYWEMDDIIFHSDSTRLLTNQQIIFPKDYILYQNYPNPVNPTTNIRFEIPGKLKVRLYIYNILGREVQSVIYNEEPPGIYELQWDASQVSSGIYLYTLDAGGKLLTRKMVVIK